MEPAFAPPSQAIASFLRYVTIEGSVAPGSIITELAPSSQRKYGKRVIELSRDPRNEIKLNEELQDKQFFTTQVLTERLGTKMSRD